MSPEDESEGLLLGSSPAAKGFIGCRGGRSEAMELTRASVALLVVAVLLLLLIGAWAGVFPGPSEGFMQVEPEVLNA